MGKIILHHAADLVEVSYRPDLAAVYLKWFSEYDEGTRVQDAVLAALTGCAPTMFTIGSRMSQPLRARSPTRIIAGSAATNFAPPSSRPPAEIRADPTLAGIGAG